MKINSTFSGFSTNDLESSRDFYGTILDLEISGQKNMGLEINLPDGAKVFIYPKEDHKAATFTVLNFIVDDIDTAVDELIEKGVKMETFDLDDFKPDEKGIYRSTDPAMGPTIAWFKDPAGNVLSLIEDTNAKGGD